MLLFIVHLFIGTLESCKLCLIIFMNKWAQPILKSKDTKLSILKSTSWLQKIWAKAKTSLSSTSRINCSTGEPLKWAADFNSRRRSNKTQHQLLIGVPISALSFKLVRKSELVPSTDVDCVAALKCRPIFNFGQSTWLSCTLIWKQSRVLLQQGSFSKPNLST